MCLRNKKLKTKVMRIFKILLASMLFMCFVYSCSPEDLNTPDEIIIEDTPIIADTPIVAAITEDLFDGVFEGFSVTDIINSDSNNRTTSNSAAKSSFNNSSSKECRFEIYDIFENTNFNFDITRDYENNPLTADEIQSILNAPVISKTESVIRYFLSDKIRSTDCATVELDEVPVPNYNLTDGFPDYRPTFFRYDDDFIITDFTGEHQYSNKFYIERKETTTPTGATSPSSVFNTKGIVDKSVDREYNAFPLDAFPGTTERTDSHEENLKLSGFFKSDKEFGGYTFEFLNGSKNYFKYSYTRDNERDNAQVSGDTEIEIENYYIVRFSILFRHATKKTYHRFPFKYAIKINNHEIIETLRENEDNNISAPYTKTVPFYLDAKIMRQIGTLTFMLDQEEKWIITLTDSPAKFSVAELEEFKVD
jgi:hypothetical protein